LSARQSSELRDAGVSALPRVPYFQSASVVSIKLMGVQRGGRRRFSSGNILRREEHLLNRNALTPDALCQSQRADFTVEYFAARCRGSVVFQTITGQTLGTNDK
jgi:hypothetical protein